MLFNYRCEFLKQRKSWRFAVFYSAQLLAKLCELSQAFVIGPITFVGPIVRSTRKAVNKSDRVAQPRWQYYRGDRKIFVVLCCHTAQTETSNNNGLKAKRFRPAVEHADEGR
jgi:hypothetical protein